VSDNEKETKVLFVLLPFVVVNKKNPSAETDGLSYLRRGTEIYLQLESFAASDSFMQKIPPSDPPVSPKQTTS
jgi:hypothetical protein